MSLNDSGIYVGAVTHTRLKPRRHKLRYGVYSMLFDLDSLDELAANRQLFAHNGFNLFSFHDRDHGNGTAEPLRRQLDRVLAEAGLDPDGGPIRLLCMPRLLGYVFNPLSVYFCYRKSGEMMAILYEVNNTFGQRHSYLIPVTNQANGTIRQHCDKQLYVSPFIDMQITYEFRVRAPGDKVALAVLCNDPEGPLLTASLSAGRRPFSDSALLGVFLSHPLLTLKVIGGIHWEALKLWLKGMKLKARPLPPARPITVVSIEESRGL